jgi:uncharacterized membrane protein YkoI
MRKRKLIVALAAIALIVGAGSLLAATDEDSETAITGEALENASAAALDHTDGGRVTDTEVGDEESYYEVEVTLEDGSQVDVQLDDEFNVVGSSSDDDNGEDDGDNDD